MSSTCPCHCKQTIWLTTTLWNNLLHCTLPVVTCHDTFARFPLLNSFDHDLFVSPLSCCAKCYCHKRFRAILFKVLQKEYCFFGCSCCANKREVQFAFRGCSIMLICNCKSTCCCRKQNSLWLLNCTVTITKAEHSMEMHGKQIILYIYRNRQALPSAPTAGNSTHSLSSPWPMPSVSSPTYRMQCR